MLQSCNGPCNNYPALTTIDRVKSQAVAPALALLHPPATELNVAGAIDILSLYHAICTVLVANAQEVNGKHLLKAEPLNAILDPQYFVRQVHECVVKVLSDRMAKEQQAADQAAPFR